jgi:hypothetical protein
MYYEEIFREFYREGIKYAVIGGMAVNLYGIPRATQDLDILTSLRKDNLLKVVKVLTRLGYVPRLPVKAEEIADRVRRARWIEEKNLKVFSLYHHKELYKTVDILLVTPIRFSKAIKSLTVIEVRDFTIPLISLRDLITMKGYAGRKQDFADVEHLRVLLKRKVQ